MRGYTCWIGVFAAMVLITAAAEENAPKETPLRIELDLVDGSRVMGAPALTSMTVRTTYAGLSISLAEIRSVDIADDHEKVSVTLLNGDRLSGVFDLGMIALKTVFGDVSIPIVHVVRFDVLSGTLNEGLVLHYTFDDDTDGKVCDSSGRGYDGHLVGPVTYEESIKGKAARLTSHKTYMVCSDPGLNVNGWREMSISIWVMIKNTRTRGRIIGRGELTGEQGGGFYMSAGGSPFGGPWDTFGAFGIQQDVNSRSTAPAATFRKGVPTATLMNTWYHLVGTYDGRSLKYYVNGELDGSCDVEKPGSPLWDHPVTKLVIGNAASASRSKWTDYYFDGLLDELQLWKRALSKTEVRQLYDSLRDK